MPTPNFLLVTDGTVDTATHAMVINNHDNLPAFEKLNLLNSAINTVMRLTGCDRDAICINPVGPMMG